MIADRKLHRRDVGQTASAWTQWLVAGSLSAAAIVWIGGRYPAVVVSPIGFVVGALLLVVSWAVGRVVSNHGRSRWMAATACGVLAVGLGSGWMDREGSETTLWAFGCISAGMFAGLVGPPNEPTDDRPIGDTDA